MKNFEKEQKNKIFKMVDDFLTQDIGSLDTWEEQVYGLEATWFTSMMNMILTIGNYTKEELYKDVDDAFRIAEKQAKTLQ